MYSQYDIRTFLDIVTAVREELQVQSTDTVSINRIKRNINVIYAEIISRKNWYWLTGTTDVTVPAFVSAGTASVTQNSNVVTLSIAPASSKKGQKFFTDSYLEIYEVESHEANSTTLKLKTVYNGTTNATATYKLFSDNVPLPTDLKETSKIWHDNFSNPLENVGRSKFRDICSTGPKLEGFPTVYFTGDYVDPSQTSSISSFPTLVSRSSSGVIKTLIFSSGVPSSIVSKITGGDAVRWKVSKSGHPSYNGLVNVTSVSTTTVLNDTITYIGGSEATESATTDTTLTIEQFDTPEDLNRFRQLFIYPYLSRSNLTLHIDYYKDAPPLDNDTDEPLIPYQDRIVLVYGAAQLSANRMGHPDKAAQNAILFERKVAQMEGKWQDAIETPILRPSKIYLNSKRNQRRSASTGSEYRSGFGGGGSTSGQSVTGTANMVAVFGSDGNLRADTLVSNTELERLDGISSSAVGISDTQTLTNKTIDAASNTISNIVNTNISSSAAIARSKLASGTAYRVLANDSSGVLSENAALTANQIVISDSNGQLTTTALISGVLTSVSLADNQSSAANVVTWTAATYDTIHLKYSIKRGSANHEAGRLVITTDGTNASISQDLTSLGTIGVTFSVDVSAGSLRLRYTSTSTGTAPTFKYIEEKWLS